jgi:hypothetical protein
MGLPFHTVIVITLDILMAWLIITALRLDDSMTIGLEQTPYLADEGI